MPKITLPQQKMTLDVPDGANLMHALLFHGIAVASSCLGDGICGKCRMTTLDTLPPPLELEKQTSLRNNLDVSERLACQITVDKDLTVTTTYW